MNGLNFSNNLIKLRHDKKITQEDLANFLGITKASVSKWETKQSLPDIMLLPQLATFFDTTIDELLGYEPQLSKEQIQKIYHDLAKNFETEDFEKVIDKSQKLIKKYYSCYPFLLQMSVLYLNHFLITDNRERQIEILTLASDLCSHISENCKDIGVCNDAIFLKASIDLQLGKANEAINSIEEILNPYRFSNQGDIILIQAYQLAGDIKKSNEFTQISMFNHLIFLVHCAIQYINIHSNPGW